MNGVVWSKWQSKIYFKMKLTRTQVSHELSKTFGNFKPELTFKCLDSFKDNVNLTICIIESM